MLLSELIASIAPLQSLSGDAEILDVTDDSREVQPGWLFVARPGTTRDGSQYVSEAIAKGAAAVVSPQAVALPVPTVQTDRVAEILPHLAARIHGFPGRRLNILGVTGTDGKTTTCYMLSSILRMSGSKTGMITTVETCIGGVCQRSAGRMTTPGAPAIQRLLHGMVSAGDTHAVIECSSHALAQHRLDAVELSAAAITNIGADHLDYHGSRERYIAAKARILDLLKPSQEPSFVVKLEDRDSLAIAKRSGRPFVTFGLEPEADIRAAQVSLAPGASQWLLVAKGEQLAVELPIGGRFNIYNALAASALALIVNVPLSQVVEGLSLASTPPGRLERIDSPAGFTVVVDYAHTEQAFGSVLTQLREEASSRGGRLIAVFGAAGDRDRDKRPRLAHLASELADYFIITTEDPFGEAGSGIIKDVAAGAPASQRGVRWEVVEDRGEAIGRALHAARSGDVVAVTGKGHEQSITVGERQIPWSDIDVIRQMLSGDRGGDGADGEPSKPSFCEPDEQH
ncbi:MAG TPA: UDP-N-acetylmuramoyl-L-alanyl-D-glutamate--2,6-diaminopimelate ligase [Chloroflexota bacterium]|nr:UDP-N-acetylmuramoyl-L-alanyl-D-glutamate--2,6-diaminopimelate ligase [Chloroflexota bacterium]